MCRNYLGMVSNQNNEFLPLVWCQFKAHHVWSPLTDCSPANPPITFFSYPQWPTQIRTDNLYNTGCLKKYPSYIWLQKTSQKSRVEISWPGGRILPLWLNLPSNWFSSYVEVIVMTWSPILGHQGNLEIILKLNTQKARDKSELRS